MTEQMIEEEPRITLARASIKQAMLRLARKKNAVKHQFDQGMANAQARFERDMHDIMMNYRLADELMRAIADEVRDGTTA